MVAALAYTLCLLTGASAPGATKAGSSGAAPAATAFALVRVEVEGFDEAAIFAALRLRMPGLRVEAHASPPLPGLSYVYLQVARGPNGATNLRVITPDGRAFDRTVIVDSANELRVAASSAANLIFAAEQGTLAPDRNHVPIPRAPTEPEPEPPPSVPIEPPVESPPTPPAPRLPTPTPVSPPSGRWEWAMSTTGAVALGLGPKRYGDRVVGGGGGLGAEVRGPRGAAFMFEVRGLGRRDEPLALGRLRFALGGGYILRRRSFELPMMLALSVEPWWVSNSSGAPALFNGGSETSRRPQLGAYLRTSPSLRLAVHRGALDSLRIGPRIELGGGFLIYDGPVVVGLADGTGDPRFRLGGLELALGVELALYFAAPKRR